MVPLESFGMVSYSPSIVTMAVSVAVCEIFSVKENCVTLKTGLRFVQRRVPETRRMVEFNCTSTRLV